MALTCGFFNSVDGDRKYDATQFASLFDGVITDGVVAAVGDFFATTPGGGMVVNVGSGRAWFNRTWTYSDAKIPLTLDASDLLYDRIDAVVLEIDTSVMVRDNSIKVLKGTPAQTPQKPTLTNSGDIHQYALAYVRVKASSIEIGAGDITINVGQADCPFVTSIVETPDLEVLFAQWDAQFTAWFENVQSQLEGDVAANLQRQIDLKANKVDIGDFETPAKKLGLTGDLSVGASLGVLATVGDLYVWRRTAVKDKPGYTLGSPKGKTCIANQTSDGEIGFQYSDSVDVSIDGNVTLKNPQTIRLGRQTASKVSTFAGKFFMLVENDLNVGGFRQIDVNTIYFADEGATGTGEIVNQAGNHYLVYISTYRTVSGYKGGTYTDYPVSTNPDAYQTGNDAQPAGYTLGKVQSGEYALNNQSADPMRFYYADDIVVDDEGNVSIGSTNKNTADIFGGWDASVLLGKFIQAYETGGSQWFSDFENNVIYFVPSDAEVTTESGPVYATYINKRQSVTGYPAIPAGTTIEYLGRLGDKARIVTGSYVGTGTYGSSNPNKLDFDRPPKIVFVSPRNNASVFTGIFVSGVIAVMIRANVYLSINWSENGLSWYTTQNTPVYQLNDTGMKYYYIAIL